MDEIDDYVNKFVHESGIRGEIELAQLFELEKHVLESIVSKIKRQNSWIFLNENTYDGWYCVKRLNKYSIYYQEKGQVCWGEETVNSFECGLAKLLKRSLPVNWIV